MHTYRFVAEKNTLFMVEEEIIDKTMKRIYNKKSVKNVDVMLQEILDARFGDECKSYTIFNRGVNKT
jgi:uncharacterized protein YlbG (UPF0298 family)